MTNLFKSKHFDKCISKNISEIKHEYNNELSYVTSELPVEAFSNEFKAEYSKIRLSSKEIEDFLNEKEQDFRKQRTNSSNRLLDNCHSAIVIPRENLNRFFIKLASVSKLNVGRTNKNRRNSNTLNLELTNSSGSNTNTTNISNILDMENAKKVSKLENISVSNKQKDISLIDAKLNFNEILNDKNLLLLTEENLLNYSNEYKDVDILNFNVNLNDKRNNLSFSVDEHIDVSIHENKLKNELKLSTEFDTFSKQNKKEIDVRNLKNLSMCIGKSNQIEINGSKATSASSKTKSTSKNSTNVKKPYLNKSVIEKEKPTTPINKIGKVIPKHNKTNSMNIPSHYKLETSLNATNKSTINSGKACNTFKSKSPVNKIPILHPSPILKTSSQKITRPALTPGTKIKRPPTTPVSYSKTLPKTSKDNFKLTSKTKIHNTSLMNPPSARTNKLSDSFVLNRTNTKGSIAKSLLESKPNTSRSKNQRTSLKGNMKSSEINVIEEYDYSKILLELRAIFGDELELFDENLLFSNLDELSNKGLIKGLIKLAHVQDKKIRTFELNLSKVKSQFRSELLQKDKVIKQLNVELNNMKFSLKGLLNEPYETESNLSFISNTNQYGTISTKRHTLKFKTMDK